MKTLIGIITTVLGLGLAILISKAFFMYFNVIVHLFNIFGLFMLGLVVGICVLYFMKKYTKEKQIK